MHSIFGCVICRKCFLINYFMNLFSKMGTGNGCSDIHNEFRHVKEEKGKTRRKRNEKCYMLIMTTQNGNNQIHVASNIWNANLKTNQTNIWTHFAFRSGLKIDFHLNKFQNFVGFFFAVSHWCAHPMPEMWN